MAPGKPAAEHDDYPSSMKEWSMRRLVWVLSVLAIASPSAARQTNHVMPVQEAVQSDLGRERLSDVPFYFAGQEHPPVVEEVSVARSNRSTRGLFRSDEEACQVAFLSALIQLQARARQERADAIVDIISVTKNRHLTSATEYRCIAGATVVHVGLEGRLVRFQKGSR